MHKHWAAKGLVTLSVSIEEERQTPEQQAAVLKFLQKQQANFPNLILDEPSEVWNKKLGFDLRPCVYLFNRAGQWRRFDATDLGEEDADAKIEKLIEAWLKDK